MTELKITAANFENEVLHSDKPVLLDFYADWCGPCKMLSPILHELAEEKSGALKVGKIKSRLKSPSSIMNKMQKRGLPLDFPTMQTNIMDIAGVRVICSFEEDVFFLAKCLKDQSDIEIITEKDYISHPKPNGYRSLHLTIRLPVFFAEKEIHVPVEIQLRTIAMDFWASLEHTIRYKKNLPINAEVETELKECADSSREWDSKMEHLLHILT